MLNVGDPIPLFNQLADYDPTKYVRAVVQNPDGTPISGSPLTLAACDANGGYRNFLALMPNVNWLRASYLVYDDAGFTILSVTEGGNAQTFLRSLAAGDVIPLFCQLANYDATKYVRAFVQDASGAPIAGSPFALVADGATGSYRNVAAIMPVTPWVEAKYAVYDDAGFTTLSGASGGDSEVLFLTTAINPAASSQPQTSNIVGFVDPDSCNDSPIEDTIVQGSTRLLAIRLASALGGNPFNLTGASAIEFRMRKTDGSILSVSLLDFVIIVNAGGGQITVTLSAAQTALLAAGVPAPATIKVTLAGKVTVVNLSTQLAVEEAEI